MLFCNTFFSLSTYNFYLFLLQVLLWVDGHKIEALTCYFSELKENKERIEEDWNAGITKSEAIENILYSYEKDKTLIDTLFEEKIINEKEQKELTRISVESKKNQIHLIYEVYTKSPKELKIKPKNNY